ncbi:MAG: adenylate/guanylate cyclase domain-containing protein [Myxococcales bacterium]
MASRWPILALLWLFACSACDPSPGVPRARAGVLDLRAWDFAQRGPVALQGQYRVAWNALLTPGPPSADGSRSPREQQFDALAQRLLPVPGQWLNLPGLPSGRPGHGAATYQLKVLLGRASRGLALQLPFPTVALRTWVNGVLIAERGRPALSREQEQPALGHDVAGVPDGVRELTLVFQASNHSTRTGGFAAAPRLGPREAVLSRLLREFVGTALIFGILLIIGSYHLGLSLVAPNHEAQRLLAYNAFAVATHQALASGATLATLSPSTLPPLWLLRVEYLALYLSMPLGVALTRRLFPAEMRAPWFRWFEYLGAGFCLLVLVLPVELFTRTLNPFGSSAMLAQATVLVAVWRALREGRPQAGFLLFAGLIHALANTHDFMVAHGFFPRWLGDPRGPSLLLLFGAQAYSLAKRFADASRRELELMRDVQAKNQALERTNRSIERFVPSEILALLKRGSVSDVQRGDQVELTMEVLFCDIRGFTSLVEATPPGQAFHFINDYLQAMEPAVHAEGGFINQYLGDCIMALYPTGADAALRSALAMLEQLAEFNRKRPPGQAPLRVGIGISSGPVILGAIGGSRRLDSGVVGDAVNLAARVESLTSVYGVPLLLSEHTVARLQDPGMFDLREIDRVVPKGKKQSVRIFEVVRGTAEERAPLQAQSVP